MGKNKKPRSEADRNKQKERTAVNQLRKYEKLIKDYPNSKDIELWKNQVTFYSQFTQGK